MDLGDKTSLKREKRDALLGLVSTIVVILPRGVRVGARSADLISERVHTYDRAYTRYLDRAPHLHAAVIIRPGLRDAMRYTGPLFPGPGRGENRARDRSRPLYLSLFSFFLFLLTDSLAVSVSFLGSIRPRRINAYSITPTKSVGDRSCSERWWPFILIHAGDLER